MPSTSHDVYHNRVRITNTLLISLPLGSLITSRNARTRASWLALDAVSDHKDFTA